VPPQTISLECHSSISLEWRSKFVGGVTARDGDGDGDGAAKREDREGLPMSTASGVPDGSTGRGRLGRWPAAPVRTAMPEESAETVTSAEYALVRRLPDGVRD